MKLSILTCSLLERKSLLYNLEKHLMKQNKKVSGVELLVNVDNGEKTIGLKRNELLNAAKGEYVTFIDDDDWVSNDYIEKILTAIKYKSPDCCGIEGILKLNNKHKQKFIHSIKYDKWYSEGYTHYRCPNHLNPIKKEIALSVGFKDISYGEDFDFSLKLKSTLKTEVYIKGEIYIYRPNLKHN